MRECLGCYNLMEPCKNLCSLHEEILWDACGQGWAIACLSLVCVITQFSYHNLHLHFIDVCSVTDVIQYPVNNSAATTTNTTAAATITSTSTTTTTSFLTSVG